MSRRDNGYYWIRACDNGEWGIAKWEGYQFICVEWGALYPNELYGIDENRITRPTPKKNKTKERVKNVFSCLRRGNK